MGISLALHTLSLPHCSFFSLPFSLLPPLSAFTSLSFLLSIFYFLLLSPTSLSLRPILLLPLCFCFSSRSLSLSLFLSFSLFLSLCLFSFFPSFCLSSHSFSSPSLSLSPYASACLPPLSVREYNPSIRLLLRYSFM